MDIAALLASLVAKYPIVSLIIMIIGILRVINKPLFAIAHAVVEQTPSKSDDLALDKVEHSAIYIGFCHALDWFTSIKLSPIVKAS